MSKWVHLSVFYQILSENTPVGQIELTLIHFTDHELLVYITSGG